MTASRVLPYECVNVLCLHVVRTCLLSVELRKALREDAKVKEAQMACDKDKTFRRGRMVRVGVSLSAPSPQHTHDPAPFFFTRLPSPNARNP